MNDWLLFCYDSIMFSRNEILIACSLMLLPVIFFLLTLIWKKKVKSRFGNIDLVDQLTINYSPLRYNLKFIVPMLGLLLMILSAANSNHDTYKNNDNANGTDLVIAFDASKSMLSKDVNPSRMEKGKLLADKLITSFVSNRVGLIVFAGQPFLQMPVTTDLSSAGMYIDNISAADVPEGGTNIGAALQLCDSTLNLHEKRNKIIVLISDGEDQDNKAEKEANDLHKDGITVFTIGVGTAAGSYISVNGQLIKDDKGELVTSRLNETLLKNIAATTNGSYFFLDDVNTVAANIVSAVNKPADKNRQQPAYWLFLVPALLLFIIENFIPETKTGY